MITIHQRVHLWLWNWRTGPGWCRSADALEWAQLRADGARAVRIQLQDNGSVWPGLVAGLKERGWKVWGAMRPSYAPLGGMIWEPVAAAEWAASEKRRLKLDGLDFNFEREVRDADKASGGAWSRAFVGRFRALCPTLPCALDTVYGDFAGGIENVYTPGIRFNVQTYWGEEGIWDDPPTNILRWCAGAQPRIRKAIVKPVVRVAPNNAGELPDPKAVIFDCQRAGMRGVVFYYVDGAPLPYLRAFIRDAIARGVAY